MTAEVLELGGNAAREKNNRCCEVTGVKDSYAYFFFKNVCTGVHYSSQMNFINKE